MLPVVIVLCCIIYKVSYIDTKSPLFRLYTCQSKPGTWKSNQYSRWNKSKFTCFLFSLGISCVFYSVLAHNRSHSVFIYRESKSNITFSISCQTLFKYIVTYKIRVVFDRWKKTTRLHHESTRWQGTVMQYKHFIIILYTLLECICI